MNNLPEDCIHLIFKFCFDDILKALPQVKDIQLHEWSTNCPRLTINDLLQNSNMSYNLIFLEEKNVGNFDSRIHRYSNISNEIKSNVSKDTFVQTIKDLDKGASICFRDHSIFHKVENEKLILIQKFGIPNWFDIIGILCDWKQYLQ